MMDAYLNYKLANEPSAKMAAKWIGIKPHCFLLLPANNFCSNVSALDLKLMTALKYPSNRNALRSL